MYFLISCFLGFEDELHLPWNFSITKIPKKKFKILHKKKYLWHWSLHAINFFFFFNNLFSGYLGIILEEQERWKWLMGFLSFQTKYGQRVVGWSMNNMWGPPQNWKTTRCSRPISAIVTLKCFLFLWLDSHWMRTVVGVQTCDMPGHDDHGPPETSKSNSNFTPPDRPTFCRSPIYHPLSLNPFIKLHLNVISCKHSEFQRPWFCA